MSKGERHRNIYIYIYTHILIKTRRQIKIAWREDLKWEKIIKPDFLLLFGGKNSRDWKWMAHKERENSIFLGREDKPQENKLINCFYF